jgi:subtilisin family serine protease
MDPALKELIAQGDPDAWVEAIIRQDPRARTLPSPLRVMSEFEDIKTVRVRRRDLEAVWADPGTASVKAPRILQFERPLSPAIAAERQPTQSAVPRPLIGERGKGVVVGIVDWGFDFGHPAFRDAAGNTRIDALWDQRGEASHRSPRFGYGKVHRAAQINRALTTQTPYKTLGYHPGSSDIGLGAHGTHVADIAAGSRRGTIGKVEGGLAPEAKLAVVHLASAPLSGLANLGDSVRLLEAIDFLHDVAGDRPLVINLSVGRHGGPHTGLTLVEQAFDRFLESHPDRLIVQSAGNYRLSRAHAQGRVLSGQSHDLHWEVDPGDTTPNELEIWYSDRDDLQISITPPGARDSFSVARGQSRALYGGDGAEVGRLYHRAYDPNTPDHHFEAFLRPSAPAGTWKITLHGKAVEDGRYHAWIERDGSGKRQSRFAKQDVSESSTIGSICNGFLPISVGAAHEDLFGTGPASFASAGPTRDGRQKPDLSAPGFRIRAARSTPRWRKTPGRGATVMSGASQASPYVAGLAAAWLSAQDSPRDIHAIRAGVFDLLTPLPKTTSAFARAQMGAGVMDPRQLAKTTV